MQKIKDNFKLVKFVSPERFDDYKQKVNVYCYEEQTNKKGKIKNNTMLRN